MKKVFIMFIAFSLVFSSCKETTKNNVNKEITEVTNDAEKGLNNIGNSLEKGYENTKESIQSAFSDIEIPKLDDEKAEAHLKNYATYVKTQFDKGAENIKNSDFAKETEEFAEKSEMYMKNLGKDAKASFKSALDKIEAKANEIEKNLEK